MSTVAPRAQGSMPAASTGDLCSASTREKTSATASIRVEAAVASLRGTRHAVNEDWHSPLDRWCPLFVVADGVG